MTPNPWERLREVVAKWLDIYDSDDSEGWLAAVNAMREALAALPATPPQQPVPDEERERAIEALRDDLDALEAEEREEKIQDWMRSAPAPQPVPAPPASDWRERFDKLRLHDRLKASPDAGWCDRVSDASYALRDGLAALEAEVARLRAKVGG